MEDRYVVLWEHNQQMPWKILNYIEAKESIQAYVDEYSSGALDEAVESGELCVYSIGETYIDSMDIYSFMGN